MANKFDFKLSSPEQTIEHMGATFASIRLARNITQEELAAMAGISSRTLSRFESGENASLDTLVRLMQALNLHDHLAALLPNPSIQPVRQLAQKSDVRTRKRSSSAPKNANKKWTWDEEIAP